MNSTASTLAITLKRGVWRISLDDGVCGDYRAQRRAVDGANAAAMVLRGDGHAVNIVASATPP